MFVLKIHQPNLNLRIDFDYWINSEESYFVAYVRRRIIEDFIVVLIKPNVEIKIICSHLNRDVLSPSFPWSMGVRGGGHGHKQNFKAGYIQSLHRHFLLLSPRLLVPCHLKINP